MAKLITDICGFGEMKLITESQKDKSKPPMYILEGLYACSEQKNGNGRSYPYELLKSEIERFDKEMVQTGRALGALEHPAYPEIKPEDSCIRILQLKEDNKSWIGRSCILASAPEYGIKGTPKGDLLLSLVQYGTKVGFSTRALGELNEDETEVVDMQLCTIDCVTNPSIGQFCDSNGNRFVNGILESKQFVCNYHPIYEKSYDKFNKKISKMPRTNISSKKAEYIGSAVNDFLNSFIK